KPPATEVPLSFLILGRGIPGSGCHVVAAPQACGPLSFPVHRPKVRKEPGGRRQGPLAWTTPAKQRGSLRPQSALSRRHVPGHQGAFAVRHGTTGLTWQSRKGRRK